MPWQHLLHVIEFCTAGIKPPFILVMYDALPFSYNSIAIQPESLRDALVIPWAKPGALAVPTISMDPDCIQYPSLNLFLQQS